MSISIPTLAKTLVAAGLLATLAAAGAAGVSADRGGLKVCPEGWRQVTPPGNPVLLCLPDTLVFEGEGSEAPPEAFCPEGWLPATPPLNPVLACLPGTIVRTSVPKLSRAGDGSCPAGFRPATSPLSPVLGCMPDNFYLPPVQTGAAPIPPGGCPAGWNPVTPPLNPMLVCLPGSIVHRPPSGPNPGR